MEKIYNPKDLIKRYREEKLDSLIYEVNRKIKKNIEKGDTTIGVESYKIGTMLKDLLVQEGYMVRAMSDGDGVVLLISWTHLMKEEEE